MPSTFGPGLAVDPVTLAPVPNALIRVMDTEGTVEYATQDIQGNARLVFTDHRGQYPQFQIAESVSAALLVSPPYMQRIASLEALQRAFLVLDDAATLKWSRGALGETDLNTLTTPGTYWQSTPSFATKGRGYPEDGALLVLVVEKAATTTATQRATRIDGTGFVETLTRTVSSAGAAPTPWRREPVTRLTTAADSAFADLAPGMYYVPFGAHAKALGLPVEDHGLLIVQHYGGGVGAGGAFFFPRTSGGIWRRPRTSGTWGAWSDMLPQIPTDMIRGSRLVTSDSAPLDFKALGTGIYQVTRSTDGAALGLPTTHHGTLHVQRWVTGAGRPGMATWTTRPIPSSPSEVWTTDIANDGSAVKWTRVVPSATPTQGSTADMGLRHHYIETRHAATIGGPIDVGTATPVCFTWDDYPADFKRHGLHTMAAELGIPMTLAFPSRSLDPGHEWLRGDPGTELTWAEIDGWVQAGWAELANHSATHVGSRTEADMWDEIVTAKAELESRCPSSAPIRTWVMPDQSWPGLDQGRTADGWASYAGQLILGHHAFATGKDSIRTDHTVPMTGAPFQGANRRWIEAEGLTDATRRALVSSSYGSGRGVILAAHPKWIGQGTRWTLAEVRSFFAWLRAEEDAGRIKLMHLSRWAWARTEIAP